MGAELALAVFGLSGVAAGFFAGSFGIGGGLIMVPVLVYAFKTTGTGTEHAVAMALVSLGHWMLGYIDLPALEALVAGTLVTVRFGVAVAHWLPSRILAALFALFLILNGTHLLYSALTS